MIQIGEMYAQTTAALCKTGIGYLRDMWNVIDQMFSSVVPLGLIYSVWLGEITEF